MLKLTLHEQEVGSVVGCTMLAEVNIGGIVTATGPLITAFLTIDIPFSCGPAINGVVAGLNDDIRAPQAEPQQLPAELHTHLK